MPTISFRIDDETKERLDRLVERGLSSSQTFRDALEDNITALEGKAPRGAGVGLTLKERMMLSNQCRLLAAAYPDEAPEHHRYAEALQSGYELEYGELTMHFSAGLSRDECSEVLDILQMYDELAFSYDELGADSGIDRDEVAFPGFDGNYEGAWMGYARFVVERQGRFRRVGETLGPTGFNSHFPSLPRHRAMLRAHRKVQRAPSPLSAQDIKEILVAGDKRS